MAPPEGRDHVAKPGKKRLAFRNAVLYAGGLGLLLFLCMGTALGLMVARLPRMKASRSRDCILGIIRPAVSHRECMK